MKRKFIIILLLTSLILNLVGCVADKTSETEENIYPSDAYRTTMQYYDDFKILQLADLHLGIESDVALQIEIVKKAIRSECPDLIILTGDNFMYATKGVVNYLVKALNEECRLLTEERGRLTKFTLTFGNHDNQGDYSRYYINEVVSCYATLDGREVLDGKFAAFIDFEDDNIFGLTNFYIDLVDDVASSPDTVDVKYRLHIIDSNTYHYLGSKYGYDVIHNSQLSHVQNIYETATADKDYIGMAFFHIPFFEYQDAYNQFIESDNPEKLGQGKFLEGVLHPYENNGSFSSLRAANIISFVCGHDHINYGDFIYHPSENDFYGSAILSYGVKSTNQLYHNTEMIGYKTITLRDISPEEFVSIENINKNFKNEIGGYENYENN